MYFRERRGWNCNCTFESECELNIQHSNAQFHSFRISFILFGIKLISLQSSKLVQNEKTFAMMKILKGPRPCVVNSNSLLHVQCKLGKPDLWNKFKEHGIEIEMIITKNGRYISHALTMHVYVMYISKNIM